jgi:hypothetical protein
MKFARKALLAMLLAFCGSASADHGIRIYDADYGRSGRACDATHSVARQCDGLGQCQVVASNRLCGDPVKGKTKELVVDFSCGRGTQSAQAIEGDVLLIDCRGGPPVNTRGHARGRGLFVHQAIYSAGRKYCDATGYFQQGCDGRQSCNVAVDNHMCGDPFRGKKKRVDIQYECGGRQYEAFFWEHQRAILDCR